jgi:uroporphyrinogen decarboxylase
VNSRERVLAALRREVPDRVPYCELGVDRALAARLLGDAVRCAWPGPGSQAANLEANTYTIGEAKAIAEALHMDNISYVLRAPIYAEKRAGVDGRLFYGAGMIESEADLPLLELPDPYDDALYEGAAAFAQEKGPYAACLVTRIGIFSTMLSLGLERFSVALYDDLSLVETVLDRYCDWTAVVAERVCKLGFDVYISTDDMAFKSAPYFSPRVFRELVLPRYRRVRPRITLPWVVHSDGNLMLFLDDLVELGIAGFHPLEKGAMDIRAVKRDYGDRICVLGNVDLNLLGMATPDEVDREVRELIRDVGPGGGYILTSGNSLAGYLRPENVVALAEAAQRYGRYPIRLA